MVVGLSLLLCRFAHQSRVLAVAPPVFDHHIEIAPPEFNGRCLVSGNLQVFEERPITLLRVFQYLVKPHCLDIATKTLVILKGHLEKPAEYGMMSPP
jgi:hypothetical protein